MKRLGWGILICLLSASLQAQVELSEDKSSWTQWPLVGKARLSWFVFDVYDSQLRSPSGQYQVNMPSMDQPLALELTYLRSISAQQLLEATQEQWVKMGYQQQKITPWLSQLASVFPDVEKNDVLALVSEGQRCQFYQRQSGQVSMTASKQFEQADLCQAFLAIWIGSQTQYPKLRQALIGVNNDQ